MAYVKCKICGERFDREKEECIKVSSTRYAHQLCAMLEGLDEYTDEMKEKEDKEKDIKKQILNKMSNILKEDYDQRKINSQITKFLGEGKTLEGILAAIDYWYDIKGGDPSQAAGGIGIIKYIYQEAQKYWQEVEERKNKNQDIKINKTIHHYYVKPTHVAKPRRLTWFHLE